MSLKRFFKKQGWVSLFLTFPFLGMAETLIPSPVTPPKVESIEQFGIHRCKDLVIQRLKLSQDLALYRWNHKLPLDPLDQEYIAYEMKEYQGKIIDEKSIQQFFEAQIDAFQVMTMEYFERWIAGDIHHHEYVPDPMLLQEKIELIDQQLIETLNSLHTLFCGTQKEELKTLLAKELQSAGFSRDVIDAATHF